MLQTGTAPEKGPDHDAQQRFSHEGFDFQVIVERELVLVRFGLTVTADEIARYATALRSQTAFRRTFSEIVDLRGTSEINLQTNDLLRLADKVDPFSEQSKRAFVVRTSVQEHAARMHKALRAHSHIAIFESIDEAETWIGS